tara:strand:+ start:1906 stop:2490 length:585 start_codon:yes stop_codon:yes gene_type:complete
VQIEYNRVILGLIEEGIITNEPFQIPKIQEGTVSLPSKLEAILYLKGRPLSLRELTELAQEPSNLVEQGLLTLMASYAQRDSALDVQENKGKYSLQLRGGLGDLVKNLLPVDLSVASLRTLATIALKKRILQSDLVDLRGSGVYDHIRELIEHDFIERKRQSEGRSYWITLSEKFHRTFSVLTDVGSIDSTKAA